jgi:hypothetical protein
MKTAEEYLKEKNITPETKHHNYDYVYHSVLGAIEQAQKDAFKEGQSNPKIKQLEWEFYGLYYDVETAVGHYMILQGDEQYWENYNTCTLTHNGSLIADFNSIDEAKAAAQADFERRVMECLDLKTRQKQALIDMMRGDEEIGLYDDNPKNH